MKPHIRLVKGYKMSEPLSGLEEAISLFLLSRAAVREHTLKQYRRILGIYQGLSPDWPPGPEGIAAFIEYFKDYEENTAYTYWAILRNFIRFCLKRRLILDDPLEGLSKPRRPSSLPRAPFSEKLASLFYYLEKQVEKVLSTRKRPYEYWGWREMRNLALFSLMLDSGLRVSEAVNIRLEDIDLDNWLIFVTRGKGSKQREVPLGRTTRADLKLYLDWRLLIPLSSDEPGYSFLFISHRRGWVPMSSYHAEKTLTRACRKAGIERITPHQLRHAFASLSHAHGAPVGRIQQWLGHTEPGTTLRYLLSREGLRDHLKSSPRDHQ